MLVLTADPNRQAQEAVELFVWRAVRECGALAASLGGVDGIVFTAGIGENHAEIRRRICERLGWLGLSIDDDANAANALCISGGESRVKRSEEHTSELKSLMRISYTVFCLQKKKKRPCPTAAYVHTLTIN